MRRTTAALFVVAAAAKTPKFEDKWEKFCGVPDCYTELGLFPNATKAQIRRAYRSLSLEFHPDKNPGNATAEQIFIKISKANDVLTDPATRENYEKYGNPDGYHGTSVTIGLPSWLTNKDNELAILVAYFVVMIVIIPVVVGLWWRNSSKFLEDGVMQNTAYRFYRQVQENTAAKYMPGILASAVEFCESVPCRSTQAADLSRLHSAVKSEFVKNQGDQNNDIMKVKTLLYAHLMREPIPASLQADLNLVLEHAHRLLNGLLNICMEQARRRTLQHAVRVARGQCGHHVRITDHTSQAHALREVRRARRGREGDVLASQTVTITVTCDSLCERLQRPAE